MPGQDSKQENELSPSRLKAIEFVKKEFGIRHYDPKQLYQYKITNVTRIVDIIEPLLKDKE